MSEQSESNAGSLPVKGTLWRHRNGTLYEVMFLTNELSENQDRYPVTVVYRTARWPERVWSRPASDWHRSMTPLEASLDNMDCERFTRSPCYLCGYNGENYFHSEVHKCAEVYHTKMRACL